LTQISTAVLILILSGCAIVHAQTFAPPDRLTQTLLVIDEAIVSLHRPSGDPRQILQHVLNALPSNSNDTKRAIREFLGRIPAPDADFLCGADFLRYRVRKEFDRIKDTLLNNLPQPAEPQLCYAVPFAVDMLSNDARQHSLELYGYDFDRAPLEIVLVGTSGFADVTFALVPRTHFHVTVKLGTNGVQFSPDSEMLALAWGNVIHHTIPIIQPSTALCESRLEEIRNVVLRYSPLQISGTANGGNRRATIRSTVTLDTVSNALDAIVCMTVTEGERTGRLFSGCAPERIFTADTDRTIERIIGDAQSSVSFTSVLKGSAIGKSGGPDGVVADWRFVRTGGSDIAEGLPELSATLNIIRVVSTSTNACVSALAYAEAKRRNVLHASTIDRLDPQLSQLNPTILKLRPRFAPP
jgi:hypothetical protein